MSKKRADKYGGITISRGSSMLCRIRRSNHDCLLSVPKGLIRGMTGTSPPNRRQVPFMVQVPHYLDLCNVTSILISATRNIE